MKKCLTYIALILFFFSGTIYVIRFYNSYQLPMLLISIIMIMITHHYSIRHFILYNNIILISYFLFAISIMISGIVQNQASTLISGIGILVLLFACSIWIPSDNAFESKYLKNISYIILIPYILVMLYSYATHGFRLFSYYGVFRTSNGSGDAAATACAAILAKITGDSDGSGLRRVRFIDIAILIFTIINALISTCRGAILSIFIMFAVGEFCIIKNEGRNLKKFITFIVGIAVLALIILLLIKTTPLGTIIQNIYYKNQYKSLDALDGRGERWDIILSRAKLFGNGEDVGIAAHNTFLSILDQYGYFSFVFLVIFSVSALIKSYRIARNNNFEGIGKFLPLMSCLGFISMSMTEGMMLKTIMLMVVFCFPLFRGAYITYRPGGRIDESNADWN